MSKCITAEEHAELVGLIDTVLENLPPIRRQALLKELDAITFAEDAYRNSAEARDRSTTPALLRHRA